MLNYLGADPGEAQKELGATIGVHVHFLYLAELYKYHLVAAVEAEGDDELNFVSKIMCIEVILHILGWHVNIYGQKNATYVNIVYLTYFIDLERIHEYN